MTVLNVELFGSPVLREKAQDARVNAETKQLIKDMFETMHAQRGVGLAAPQVGVSKRIIVIDPGHNSPQAFVNPTYKPVGSKKVESVEGCLSLPGVAAKVMRWETIVVTARDEKDRAVKVKLTGLPARIVQHEVDHLDGVLISDTAENQEEVAAEVAKLVENLARSQAPR